MGKYFNNTDIDFIQSEEVAKLLHRSDKRPENFIRIALSEDGMHLDYKSHAEFEIYRAILFIRDTHGNIYRYDFEQNDSERCFYAAIDPGNFVAISLYDPKYPMERLYMFDSDESIMGIFKTENSTIFIIYDGSKDNVGYGYYLEKEGYPSIYEKLLALFDISHPRSHDNNDDSCND